ncbi:MAG: hypothetical protein M3362_18465, partial [Acidobacteriota bacterium]|nr:hypothetical protein [Acidobacteriota bacterium]
MRVRKYICIILLFSFCLNAAAQTSQPDAQSKVQPSPAHHLMPVPASVRFNQGRLPVTKSFKVAANGHVDDRLRAGVDRMVRRLEGRTVMELERGLAADASTAALVIEAQGAG